MSNFDFWWNTYYSVFKLQPNTNTNTIRVWKIRRIRIRIYSVLKNHPNTNTNTIRFENICRIRIRISLFGLNYSNTIRIPNYSLTSEIWIIGKVLLPKWPPTSCGNIFGEISGTRSLLLCVRVSQGNSLIRFPAPSLSLYRKWRLYICPAFRGSRHFK